MVSSCSAPLCSSLLPDVMPHASVLPRRTLTPQVAFSLSPSKLLDMWIIPVSFVLITGVSAAVAWVMARMFKLSRQQR